MELGQRRFWLLGVTAAVSNRGKGVPKVTRVVRAHRSFFSRKTGGRMG